MSARVEAVWDRGSDGGQDEPANEDFSARRIKDGRGWEERGGRERID